MKKRIAAVVVLALALGGCAAAVPTAPTESTPTGEAVAADLEPFYGQVLHWTDCERGMQCATAVAPLDWSDPSRSSIDLALVRQTARTADRLGSLLVNPGGPGGSGYDFVADSIDYATDEKLQSRFDIVGFDPRGVGRSSAVACYTRPGEFDAYLYDLPQGAYGSDEWIASKRATSAAFGQQCLKDSGELLGYVDTVSAARDLDLLRAVLGDRKLNYLGYSYGTLLGATYAELFPGKTGRLVLDGAIDPTTSSFDVSVAQAKGFESALRAFLADCAQQKDCPFSGSVDRAMTKIRSILDRLDATPLRNDDGRMLGSATMTWAIVLPLYDKGNWKYLRQLFSTVGEGDPAFAFQLADSYNKRDSGGTYTSNAMEAFIAVSCLDYPSDPGTDIRSEEAEITAAAPVLGPQLAYDSTSCAGWPFPPTGTRGEIHATGSSDILVVGTTNDPATPYSWAQALASQLDRGHLITYTGEGHTAYNKSNSCVNDAVDNYFISGQVPRADPEC